MSTAERGDNDFLSEDVDVLLNEKAVEREETDINAVLAAYDKELLSFRPRAKRRTWPEPIRKR